MTVTYGLMVRKNCIIENAVVYQMCCNCTTTDPNETAKDMTDKYKTECANSKVRPIAKLLEQLEVSRSKS